MARPRWEPGQRPAACGQFQAADRSDFDYLQRVPGLIAGEWAVFGRNHDVFDACAEPILQVDAGLDRESVAGDEGARFPETMYGSSCSSIPIP